MPYNASGPPVRLLLALLVTLGSLSASPVLAQDPDPESATESADDDSEAQDSVDADADDEEGDSEEDAEAAAQGNWQPDPMDDDEDWGGELQNDPRDDAIPVDSSLDPSGLGWEVASYDKVDDSDGISIPDGAPGDLTGPAGDMPVVRPRARGGAAQRRPSDTDDDTPYSFGGNPVRSRGAPWQAQIYYPRRAPQWEPQLQKGKPLWQLQHRCGGTLIAPDWVLTAAHCIDEDDVKAGYRVRLGLEDISKETGISYKIDRIVRHSQYIDRPLPASPNRYANDIALIHIVYDGPPQTIDPTRISPIPLYEGPTEPRAEVSVTGWGKTVPVDAHEPNAVLLKVDLKVMATDRCARLPGYGPVKIHDRVICAADPGRSTCRGDSGGALTFTNGAPMVVGIVSWGKKVCSGDGQPGAYTRVASFLPWIRQAMKLDPSRNSLP